MPVPSNIKRTQPKIPYPTPQSHLKGGAQTSPVPSTRPVVLASCSSWQLDYCSRGVSSETRQGQPNQGNPSASHKKGPRQQKKEASQACLIALLLL